MPSPDRIGNQDVDRLPQKFPALIAEKALGLLIDQDDPVVVVHHDHGTRRSFHGHFEQLLRLISEGSEGPSEHKYSFITIRFFPDSETLYSTRFRHGLPERAEKQKILNGKRGISIVEIELAGRDAAFMKQRLKSRGVSLCLDPGVSGSA